MTTLAQAAGISWIPGHSSESTPFQRPMRESSENLTTTDPDALLMLEVAGGNEAALTQLIDRWKGPLVSFFYRSVRSQELAEDLAQEVFIRIYRAAPRYRPEAKFSTYLFAIARRRLINEHRRSTRKPLELVDPQDLRSVKSDQSNKQEIFEIEEAFSNALEELPPKHREAILLLKQQQLSYEEIANIMDASESSVKTWIFRARQKLKASLHSLLTS